MAPDVTSLNEFMRGLTVSRDRSSSAFVSYRPESEEIYGRSFATATYGEEHCYYLPVDPQELIREEIYHAIWTETAGPPVLVNYNEMPPGNLLDLGSGWGIWVEHASSLFRQRDIIGVDQYLHSAHPETFDNCLFEVDNYEAPFFPREQPIALIHLRDSDFSLRKPREFAGYVFEALCDGGWFQNEETHLKTWTSNKAQFNEWCRRTIEAARFLGISLHSAEVMETSLEEAGFWVQSVRKQEWEASKGTSRGEKLLEVVKFAVEGSVRILVEGGSCVSDNVCDFVEEVVRELREEDCQIVIEAETILARKCG